MRIKLAIISGAALVLTVGTGAAYAAVGQTTGSPTVAGNVLPIDDNHSSKAGLNPSDDRGGQRSTGASTAGEPGDDRGGATVEPGDDRGAATAEPGDDRGRGRGVDDRTTGASRSGDTLGSSTASSVSSDGHGSDDPAGSTTAAVAATASVVHSDDHGRGDAAAGHH